MSTTTTLPRPMTLTFTPDAITAAPCHRVVVPRWLACAALVAAVDVVARVLGVEPASAAGFVGDQVASTVGRLQGFALMLDHGLHDPFAFSVQIPAAFR